MCEANPGLSNECMLETNTKVRNIVAILFVCAKKVTLSLFIIIAEPLGSNHNMDISTMLKVGCVKVYGGSQKAPAP